jgi:hypothetical protein
MSYHPRFGLNLGVETPAIRSRLLLGAAAWQLKIDAYLYYGLDGWRQYCPSPPGALKRSSVWKPTVNQVSMALLYGRAGNLTAKHGGSRRGQTISTHR